MTHACFNRQIFFERCPFCESNRNVFVGHGSTRHCVTCVMSWGDGEAWHLARQQKSAAEVKGTFRQKVNELPPPIRRRVKDLESGLAAASDFGSRVRRLQSISVDEWADANIDQGDVDAA